MLIVLTLIVTYGDFHMHHVKDIAILEDFTSTARCDEGFLHVRRLRAQNLRADGSTSKEYRIDVIDRPRLDAVAVLVWRMNSAGEREYFTRQQLRPAAHFRAQKKQTVVDGRSHLFCEEIVAGLLEPTDEGEPGMRQRAAKEVFEEAGFQVDATQIKSLGFPFFVAPGIISEKIFLFSVDVTGLKKSEAQGDGSPLEEGSEWQFRSEHSLASAIASGEIQDAKTELAMTRFLVLQE
jgi:ADP-ribose pyrophosphatase